MDTLLAWFTVAGVTVSIAVSLYSAYRGWRDEKRKTTKELEEEMSKEMDYFSLATETMRLQVEPLTQQVREQAAEIQQFKQAQRGYESEIRKLSNDFKRCKEQLQRVTDALRNGDTGPLKGET